MNSLKITFLAIIPSLLITSCGDKGTLPLGACDCAAIEDTNSPEFAKCKDLRKEATFEAEYIKCKQAIKSGITDTSKISIGSAENATHLSAGDGNYSFDVTTSSINWTGENAVGKSHQGLLSVKSGNISISGGKITGGQVVVDMNTLTNTDLSGDDKKDLESHLKGADFFDTAKFSEATYTITSGEKMDAVKYAVKGKLTLKGITKDLNCEINVIANNSDVIVAGGLIFDRSQFDVRYGSGKFFENLGDKLIKDEIILKLEIKGKRQ